jgi:hypothetical protein
MFELIEGQDYCPKAFEHGGLVDCLQSADSASRLSPHQGRTCHSEVIVEGAVLTRGLRAPS